MEQKMSEQTFLDYILKYLEQEYNYVIRTSTDKNLHKEVEKIGNTLQLMVASYRYGTDLVVFTND